jgi:hypothetical protein
VRVIEAFEEQGGVIHFVDAEFEGVDVVGVDAEADFFSG